MMDFLSAKHKASLNTHGNLPQLSCVGPEISLLFPVHMSHKEEELPDHGLHVHPSLDSGRGVMYMTRTAERATQTTFPYRTLLR